MVTKEWFFAGLQISPNHLCTYNIQGNNRLRSILSILWFISSSFFWVNIKCTFYFHFRQTFSDFKFSESYKCRCCFFFIIHTCFHSVALKNVLRDWVWYTTIMTATCRRFCTRLFGIFLCTLFISILTPWGISVYINIKFWGFSDVCFLMLLKIDRFIYHYLL